MKTKLKTALIIAGVAVAIVSLAGGYWIYRFRKYTPAEAMKDIRAAVKAKNAPKPVEAYLEARFGPMSLPENRKQAFQQFFNVGHIEGMYIISKHTTLEQQRTNIAAMASWIADYRVHLAPEEKAALRTYFKSDEGRTAIKQATVKYLSKDVHYRSLTAPVIAELMTTLTEVDK